MMNVELISLKGNLRTRPLQLEDGQKVVIGRGEDVDIQILDVGLSRKHCAITRRGDKFILSDLNSRNGTYWNGKRITTQDLSHGDRVSIGGVEFEFRIESDHGMQKEAAPAPTQRRRQDFRERVHLDKSDLMSLSGELQNLENYRRVQRDLATIYKVGNLINADQDPERLYGHVMDSILEVIPADRGVLILERESTGELEPVCRRHREGVKPEISFSFSRTVVQECYKTGVSIIRSDLARDPQFGMAESVIMQQIQSVMCVPVESLDRILGVIYVDSLTPETTFSKHDLELVVAIAKQAGIAVQRLRLMDRIRNIFHGTVRVLVATIEAKDEYTRGHSERVTNYAIALARAMELGPVELATLELAGLLHDLGKVGVMEEILNKPRKLTEEEFALIKKHPNAGAEIIRTIENTSAIATIVRHHHERWDGKGYPDGLAGTKTPLLARILAVADTFDAMTTRRPYRDRISLEKVLECFRNLAGTQFDPKVVEVLLKEVEAGRIIPPTHEETSVKKEDGVTGVAAPN